MKWQLLGFLLLFFISSAQSAEQIVNMNGQLIGATGVEVQGELYDVSFMDGTCINLFSGCDAVEDFAPFSGNFGKTENATIALLEQVLIDTSNGNFGTDPELTIGCEDETECYVLTPYTLNGEENVSVVVAINKPSDDMRIAQGRNKLFDTSFSGPDVYAVWTPAQANPTSATVPLPQWALLIILLSLPMIGICVQRLKTHP